MGGVKRNVKVPTAFFEVSPYWAKTISEAKTVKDLAGCYIDGKKLDNDNGSGHNIQDSQTCIVGEAYHAEFDWDGCDECSSFSSRFGSILEGGYDNHGNRKQQLVQNVKDFTDHWRTVHNPMVNIDTEDEQIPVAP